MDTRIFEEIGLTKGEIKAYLALLKIGSSSTGLISKQSQVSRSKLYSVLDRLEKKGLVTHVDKNGVTYFQAVEPSKVSDYLKAKESKIKELTKKFEKFLPQLEAFHADSSKSQKVAVYQGLKGLTVAHEHLYLKLKKNDCYYYLGIPSNQPGAHHLYWQRDHVRRSKLGIKCKLLFNQDTDVKILKNRNKYSGSEARYMPSSVKTPAYFLIYKDTVMIAIAQKNPLAIEIQSEDIAKSFKAYFDEFWSQSEKLK